MDLARGDKLALAAGKGTVVYREGHFQRGSRDLDKRQRLGKALRADGIADGDVADTAHCNNIAGGSLRNGNLVQAVKLIKRHGLGLHRRSVGIVIVADLDLLILLYYAALDAADGNATDIFVIIYTGNEHLERAVQILLGLGDILQYGIKQGLEVCARNIGRVACGALAAGAEQHRGIKLLVGRVKIHKKLKHLVDDLVDALVGAVDLVDDNNDSVAKLECARQDKSRLRHRALGCVNEQDNAVYHL